MTAGHLTAQAVADLVGGRLLGDGTVVVRAVRALASDGTDLYAGGAFSMANGRKASNVARWDGLAWSSLGSDASSGIDGVVLAIALDPANGDAYVGGYLGSAGGVSRRRRG